MENGNDIPAPVNCRRPQKHFSLGLVFVLLLISLIPAAPVTAQTGAPVPSSGHRLVGTIEGGTFSGAVLTDPSGEQKFYRLNDLLPDGSRLYRLRSDRILIKQPDGSVSEVFVYRELATAVPVGSERVGEPKPNTQKKDVPRRQRPIRHKSPMYEADEQ